MQCDDLNIAVKCGEEEDLFLEILSLDRNIYILRKKIILLGFFPDSLKDKEHFCLYLQSFGSAVGALAHKETG